MKSVSKGEKDFINGGFADQDGDGKAEYGVIEELIGNRPHRNIKPVPSNSPLFMKYMANINS